MEFLTWLEHTSFGTWVSSSSSIWAYPSILTLHTIGMGLLVGTVAVVDLRILGVASIIPLAPLEGLLPVMWLGLGINALSGTALFIAGATRHGSSPLFYFKMTSVALGVVNLQLLRRQVFRHSASVETEPVGRKGKILAGTSLALWTAAITAGRLMAYYQNAAGG